MLDGFDAIVLAGGLGTRLKNVISGPKVLALVNGKPFIAYILNYLAKFNVSKVVLALGYKYEDVLQWVRGENFPFKIEYVVEESPLGTGGQ